VEVHSDGLGGVHQSCKIQGGGGQGKDSFLA